MVHPAHTDADAFALSSFKSLLTKTAPNIESDILEYSVSFFQDPTSDLSLEGLQDFLTPLLEDAGVSEDAINQLCEKVTNLCKTTKGKSKQDEGLKILEQPIHMIQNNPMDMETYGTHRIVDLSHVTVGKRQGISTVNSTKLAAADKKLAKKQDKKSDKNDSKLTYEPDPDIMVTQPNVKFDSTTKDIRIENFDVQYAGKPILRNAKLSLSFGRRYGLVGKNGSGKSTLLRAIARRDLKLPPHITMLHVEQEIAGNDVSAIQSVLQADVEREALLAEEKALNIKISAGTSGKTGKELEAFDMANARLKAVYAKLEEIESDKAEGR